MESSVRVDGEQAWNWEDRQGQTYGVLRTDQKFKVRIGNRKVMKTKQGSLETKMGWGEIRIRVPVQGYTECNTLHIHTRLGLQCYDCNTLSPPDICASSRPTFSGSHLIIWQSPWPPYQSSILGVLCYYHSLTCLLHFSTLSTTPSKHESNHEKNRTLWDFHLYNL